MVSVVISLLSHDIVRAGGWFNNSHRVSASCITGGVEKEAHQNSQPSQTCCLSVDHPGFVRHLRVCVAAIGEGREWTQDQNW